MMRALVFILCAACGAPAPSVVAIPAPTTTTTTTTSAQTRAEIPAPVAMTIVVTNAPYGELALWRPHANGKIERIATPWAKLSIIDTLTVSPNGREIAYVEGGSSFGPLLLRALADGAKTIVAPHVAGRELLVVAWSPNGRKLLYAERTVTPIPNCVRGYSSCVRTGAKSFRLHDRDTAKTTAVDLSLDEFDDVTGLEDSGEPVISSGLRLGTPSPSRKHRAAIDRRALVVDRQVLVAPSNDLVGFTWIDDTAIVAHYRNRLDVVDTKDGSVKGSITTNADDM